MPSKTKISAKKDKSLGFQIMAEYSTWKSGNYKFQNESLLESKNFSLKHETRWFKTNNGEKGRS